MIERWTVAVTLLAALLAAGCASPPPAPRDPDARLAALVEAWIETGRLCQDDWEPGRPVVDCERIRKELDALAVEFPRHPGVLLAAASVAHASGHRDHAQVHLGALATLRPVHAEVALLRARIAMEQGNLPFARRVLGEQIEISPERADLREAAAAVAYLEEDWLRARTHLDAARALGAPGWRVSYHQGLLAEATGDPSAAAQHYRESLAGRADFQRARARLRALEIAAPPAP